MNPRYNVPKITQFVRAQMERLRVREDVAMGLPFGVADLEASIKHAESLESEQETLKEKAQAATDALHLAVLALWDKAQRNIAAVVLKSGRHSPDLRVVGGKPLPGRHPRKSPKKGKGAPDAQNGGADAKVA